MRIRLACAEDAEGLRAVYAPYIDTAITFEDVLPSADEWCERVAGIRAGYPYLVAEVREDEDDASWRIAGYAYAHAQHPRAAYRWNAELSVYLAPAARGRGLGSALYRALLELLSAQGIKSAYGLVTAPNPASDALHRAFGFDVMGIQPDAGYKCGAWHGVTWYVKHLGAHDGTPAEPMPFPQLCVEQPELVERVLAEANVWQPLGNGQ